MKKLLIVSALLATTASAALAEGINLSWNDCGLTGTANTAFACNVNTGIPFTLIASFIAPAPGLPQFLGVSARLDIRSSDGLDLPDWWLHGGTVCRGATAMASNFDFLAGPFSCLDAYGGQAAGGLLYTVGGLPTLVGPDRATVLIQCAIPAGNEVPLDDATEVYALKLLITRTKTTGTGSCAGCSFPACIVLNEIQAFQPLEQNFDPKISLPADRNFVTWQTSPGADCPAATPTRNSSWGQVKSLYR